MDLKKAPFYLSVKQEEEVEKVLEEMTLEEKAGQVFCVLGELYEEDTLKDMVGNKGLGGILFRPCDTEYLKKRFAPLDAAAKIPLLKAANMEAGGIGAVSDGTRFGNQLQIAATGDAVWAKRLGLSCVAEGKPAGINWTFSPVSDIDMNYRNPITNTRTYGSDAVRVQEMTLAYMKAVQENGVAACAKHFPGDGVDYRDHHLHPTVNSLFAEEWYESYGSIYKNMIDQGLLSIMVGHILQPAVTKDRNPELKDEDILPASLSPELLTGVLRERYGFNGVISTDATIMGGYTQAMERKKAIPATIAAGCDMILFNTSFEEDYHYLLDGIKEGLLTKERLDDAVRRILALKQWIGQRKETVPEVAIEKWQKECADKSVTLVKNKENAIPLSADKIPEAEIILLGNPKCPDGDIGEIAQELLEKRGFQVELFDIDRVEMHGPGSLKKNKLVLYLANCEEHSDQTAVRLFWSKKMALDMPRYVNEEMIVFVSFANPYHLQDVPRVKTYINAYTASRATIEAVVEKLTGESGFQGISPVDAFCGLFDTHM